MVLVCVCLDMLAGSSFYTAKKAHLNSCDSEGVAINKKAEDQRARIHPPTQISILTFSKSVGWTNSPKGLTAWNLPLLFSNGGHIDMEIENTKSVEK